MASQVEDIKWVPGTRFLVDGFAFASEQCQRYFLTHYHSDHTVGLNRHFAAGTIYCSRVTSRLLLHEKGLGGSSVQVLELGQPQLIDGVTVTALDANHCPGAVMFLFEVPSPPSKAGRAGSKQGRLTCNILHTGDCRWRDELAGPLGSRSVDILMLDTTYALPRYTFPSQQEAIAMMVQAIRDALHEQPNTLFVVGSYHIGKERAYLGAAQALGMKVYAPAAKRRVLQLLELPQEQLELLTDDRDAQMQVTAMVSSPQQLQEVLDAHSGRWKRVMGFRPTGWAYRRSGGLQVWREGDAACVGIPYSEHSSFPELRACVARLRPRKLIPTVNAGSKEAAAQQVERFVDLMDLQQRRDRIDFYVTNMSRQKQQQQQQQPSGTGFACIIENRGTDGGNCDGCSGVEVSGAVSNEQHPDAAAAAADTAVEVTSQQQLHARNNCFDLSAVDVAEQQALLDQMQRLQRLKRSVALQATAKKKQRSRRQCGPTRS